MSREQQERERQKALLLRLIQQQRLDLSASHRHWIEATAPIDRGWNTFPQSAFMGNGRQRHRGNMVRSPSALFDALGKAQPRYLEHLADGTQSAASVRIALRLMTGSGASRRPASLSPHCPRQVCPSSCSPAERFRLSASAVILRSTACTTRYSPTYIHVLYQ
ncbi:inner membrane protein YqjK [Klebsiella michiganensis]|uniref:Inner membrane protein YqjK n=1 Tax=Klebsiella michiganensis TaxID=1134687 RepID=A0A7H4PHE2_9ENTR|nr:inner membrane protein YqjK [Klebsiella michiganensis]